MQGCLDNVLSLGKGRGVDATILPKPPQGWIQKLAEGGGSQNRKTACNLILTVLGSRSLKGGGASPKVLSGFFFLALVQIKVPSLQARCYHSATVIPHTPTLMEVVLFGGCPEWPQCAKTDADHLHIGNTVVLRLGESFLLCSMSHAVVILALSCSTRLLYMVSILENVHSME